jgi:hypothetical protein
MLVRTPPAQRFEALADALVENASVSQGRDSEALAPTQAQHRLLKSGQRFTGR